ncbi:MAG: prepilin-type N-terminal cleavage/methylation domain-containing protein [Planctomycetota bacterium]
MKVVSTYGNVKEVSGMPRACAGFSLAELLAAMTIGAMIMVSILGIYTRAERSAAAVMLRLDNPRLAQEILQRIAEDLDSVISSDSDAKITIENKFDSLLPAARLTITRTVSDSRLREQKFEEIIWQSSYDFEGFGDGLVLYRSYGGINMEDKVLDKDKDDAERELLVPICGGVTFFRIEALTGKTPAEKWGGSPPPGIAVTISFAEPFKRVDGTFDVLEEDKITRTIAIDRTRKIKFAIEESGTAESQEKTTDANSPDGDNAPSPDPKKPEKAK